MWRSNHLGARRKWGEQGEPGYQETWVLEVEKIFGEGRDTFRATRGKSPI